MTLLTCSHCDGAIKPRREAKDRHGRRRYCSRTCSAAGARAAAKAARALLLRRCEAALKQATNKARAGSADDVYALKDALELFSREVAPMALMSAPAITGFTGGHRALREFVIHRDGGRCKRCGSRELLVADHILSRRNGGAHHPNNLQCLCDSCNSRKAGREDSGRA